MIEFFASSVRPSVCVTRVVVAAAAAAAAWRDVACHERTVLHTRSLAADRITKCRVVDQLCPELPFASRGCCVARHF